MADVAGPVRGCRLAQETQHAAPVGEPERADAERRRYCCDERPESRRSPLSAGGREQAFEGTGPTVCNRCIAVDRMPSGRFRLIADGQVRKVNDNLVRYRPHAVKPRE